MLRLDHHAERRLKGGAPLVAFLAVPVVLGLARQELLQRSPSLLATVEFPLGTTLERWLVGELLALWLALFVAARTAAHNALIDACNILSRACARAGRSNDWRRRLGDDRKELGDFACHVHAHRGVLAR